MKWPRVRIDDIAATGTGGTPLRNESHRFFGGAIPWVKSGELRDAILTSTEELITDEALAESSAKRVPVGAVLVALYGATVGKTALLGVEATTNQAVCHIVPNPRVAESKFVWFAMRAELPNLLRKRVGGAQPNISQHIVRTTTLPLPAKPEQLRIVELLEQADALRRQRTEADALSARILPALFHKMSGRRERISEWPLVNLGDVTAIDAPMVDPRDSEFSALPHIGPDRIEGRTGRLLPTLTAQQEGLISGKFLFDQRHVLYSKIRPYLRKVALPEARGLCSADMYPVTPLAGHATREYVWALLMSDAFTNFTAERSGRANIPKVNREQFAAYTFRLPPLPLQREFSDKVARHRKLAAQQESSRDSIEKLFQTMLHRAFTGELTARWREAHVKELLAEMEQQTRALNLPVDSHSALATLLA